MRRRTRTSNVRSKVGYELARAYVKAVDVLSPGFVRSGHGARRRSSPHLTFVPSPCRPSAAEAFESFLNQPNDRQPPEFLSSYLDEQMKVGLKGKSEDEIAAVLNGAVVIFRFLSNKVRNRPRLVTRSLILVGILSVRRASVLIPFAAHLPPLSTAFVVTSVAAAAGRVRGVLQGAPTETAAVGQEQQRRRREGEDCDGSDDGDDEDGDDDDYDGRRYGLLVSVQRVLSIVDDHAPLVAQAPFLTSAHPPIPRLRCS